MNVLYYLDWFPKLSQSFILNEIYYLSQQGHNVAVFSLNKPDAEVHHDELKELDIDLVYADNPSIISVPRDLTRSIFNSRPSHGKFFSSPRHRLGTIYLLKQCRDFVESLDYELDHVHSHFLRWNKVPAAILAEDLGISSSLTTHAYDLYASPHESTMITTCNAFDTLLTISEYNEQYLNIEFDLDTAVEVVRAGIRTEKFGSTATPPEPRFLTISRFVEKKGIEYALLAVEQCIEKYPELDYRLIGSGPRRERYQGLITKLGIENNVTFLGSVSDEELIHELDHARAFVLPCVVAKDGDRDGIPVAILESMAMKTPAISTYISGIPELIQDGKNGFLCSERSVSDITAAMYRCLDDMEFIEEVGDKARSRIKEQHDIKTIGPILESVFSF